MRVYGSHLLLLLLIIVVVAYVQAAGDCNKSLNPNSRIREPLFFDQNGKLLETENSANGKKLIIKENQELIASCGPNYFKDFGNNRAEQVKVTYESCQIKASGEKTEDQPDSGCDLRVIEEVLDDLPGCAWTATRFGFVHPTEQKAHIIGEACYNEKLGQTIYAHVKLGDKDNNYLERQERTYLTRRRHPDGRYKIELFRGLLFDEIYARLRESTSQEAPMLHMTNFISDPLLSNGQFQEIKKLGWNYFVAHDELTVLDSLKQDIEEFSKNHIVDVYIGAAGVRKLGAGVEVYLHENVKRKRFPMPAQIWLLVQNGENVTGFSVRNAAPNETHEESALCGENVCSQITWLKASRNVAELNCCTYAKLKSAVPELPALGLVKGLLV